MTSAHLSHHNPDTDPDPTETREWLDAFNDVLEHQGTARAQFLLQRIAAKYAVALPFSINTPYRNTIPEQDEPPYPGDLYLERRLRSIIRWNAMAMVMRANRKDASIGGHISTFMSIATLQEVGFHHFFRAPNESQDGDLVFFQGHSSPGVYARSFLEGRFDARTLDHFRQETRGEPGLSSYPHPWLMPEYWQFPTVSMGLGPMQAIYQAHVMRYLHHRKLINAANRKVWCFVGDGETDEPETLGSIALAGREKLDNLIFVINCNLQRLDGPVRGNGKIIQELEGVFRGAGWNVIKVVWGKYWDTLLQRDKEGWLQQRMEEAVDGEYQNFKNKGSAYTREHFFGKYPQLLAMVEHLSDEDIERLNRGGHDVHKIYAAYLRAIQHRGQPTVILAKTVKGYGTPAEAENMSHSAKKFDLEGLRRFRDRFELPIDDDQLPDLPYYKPSDDAPEMRYLHARRQALGGYLPQRNNALEPLEIPPLMTFNALLESSGKREISTTMAFVRLLTQLTKDVQIGARIVPIVPDEARTFGMEGMFRQLSIYTSEGQKYTPQDADRVMYYREDIGGQILQEGINEAGAMSAWIAAATACAHHRFTLIPFYTFYSMFGFQRIGDFAWAAGDQRARGFLIGATSGRTTLAGEGLQHDDGHSHILASTIPNCVAYDPAYAYELAVIVQDAMRRMYQEGEAKFFYLTVTNENYHHPAMPEGVEWGIIKGLYRLENIIAKNVRAQVRLIGCGAILREAREAAQILAQQFQVSSTVFSATSFTELAREAARYERQQRQGKTLSEKSHLAQSLDAEDTPIVAVSDYVCTHCEQIRRFLSVPYYTLGTDGFGRSDGRAALRHFFEVDAVHIAATSLFALRQRDILSAEEYLMARQQLHLDVDKPYPLDEV